MNPVRSTGYARVRDFKNTLPTEVRPLIDRLRAKERRGSKPRCHLLTHGSRDEVARRLTRLAAPFAAVSPDDCWMPQGFDDCVEAQLHKADRILDSSTCKSLAEWWLAPRSGRAMTPNFDLASTCFVEGRKGLLLVEAKAHDEELHKERAGRTLHPTSSEARRASHGRIGDAILAASKSLSSETGRSWNVSRDCRYQMSNRFAWAWKLATFGKPVVLVYLGFLRAEEMSDRGKPFSSLQEWERVVQDHGEGIVPADIWNKSWPLESGPLIPLIRSLELPEAGAEPELPAK